MVLWRKYASFGDIILNIYVEINSRTNFIIYNFMEDNININIVYSCNLVIQLIGQKKRNLEVRLLLHWQTMSYT